MNVIERHLEFGGSHNEPNRIVVHAMGENIRDDKVYNAVEWLAKLELSAHALVTPSGDVIRCRNDDEGAWHAKSFNTNSLGIEFLVQGIHDYGSFIERIKTPWVTPAQYQAGLEQIKEWIYKFSIERIDRHSDVSPGRKVDPGAGFPWQQLLSEIFDDQYTGVLDG